MKIILLGMPGSGKSTIAEKIANLKKLQLIDSDTFIESKYHLTINEIFEKFGESEFRKYEHLVLEEILEKDNFILATGGGMPCYYNNIDTMNKGGTTVYLKASVQSLAERLKNDKISRRPLLKEKSEEEILIHLREILSRREPFYCSATHIIDTDIISIDEIIKLPLFND